MSRWAVFDWVAGVAEEAELAEAEDEGDGEVEPVAGRAELEGLLVLIGQVLDVVGKVLGAHVGLVLIERACY